MHELATAGAVSPGDSLELTCDLTLEPGETVTKRLVLTGAAASDIAIDCAGGTIDGGEGTPNEGKDMILIRSTKPAADPIMRAWSRPQNISIRDCTVVGGVRTIGMTGNGAGEPLRESSYRSGHAGRARTNAPRDITLEDNTLVGTGRIPLYVGMGTTRLRLLGGEVTGRSTAVAIYLDAESAYNEIRDVYVHPTTGRELIAVDGSARNRIINNRFSSLNRGGLYLYRNCGERRVSRHTTPSHNHIINNVFYYNEYTGLAPSVYLGSRNGPGAGAGYCGKDSASSYGSGVSDHDWARYNVVMQNQIYKRSTDVMIRTYDTKSYPNYVAYNDTVTSEVSRAAGCYVANGYNDDFLRDGQSIDLFEGSRGAPVCTGYRYACDDGDLSVSYGVDCDIARVEFECTVVSNNDGCSKRVSCPDDTRIIASVAGCNLEWGTVSTSALSAILFNTMTVLRASDSVSAGSCWMGVNSLSEDTRYVYFVNGGRSVNVGCKEHDKNGGDCQIRGELYCR